MLFFCVFYLNCTPKSRHFAIIFAAIVFAISFATICGGLAQKPVFLLGLSRPQLSFSCRPKPSQGALIFRRDAPAGDLGPTSPSKTNVKKAKIFTKKAMLFAQKQRFSSKNEDFHKNIGALLPVGMFPRPPRPRRSREKPLFHFLARRSRWRLARDRPKCPKTHPRRREAALLYSCHTNSDTE